MLAFENSLPTQVKELCDMLRDICSESQWEWLKQALASIDDAALSNTEVMKKVSSALLIASASAKRELGGLPVVIYGQSPTWFSHDIARVLLLQQFKRCLCQLLQTQPEHSSYSALQAQWSQHLLQVYRRFGEDEKALLVRSLFLLGESELLPIALDASRTNDESLFATLALNNPFPSQHFPERNFHQLVLKALFIDLDIKHIQGLSRRLSPELSQLCLDLVEERKLASREIPLSIWLAIRPEDLPQDSRQGHQQDRSVKPNTASANSTSSNTTGQPLL
ncbi:EboA domain-containing protein [Alteromonas sp. a30]|uniref:EboA domain-containing protein n=1 Tax=Alteromonas sp. a30 TaxID=2730917 RepID=UPI00227F9C55|nr:EboA domain-containing protein [Alteromonas sp. a30]MCY7297261.1 EboA domain-containing protein [Alteromonas sp. a30]